MNGTKYFLEPKTDEGMYESVLANCYSYWGEIEGVYPNLEADEPQMLRVYSNDRFAGIGWMTYDVQYYDNLTVTADVYAKINDPEISIEKTALINRDTVGDLQPFLDAIKATDNHNYRVTTKKYRTNSIELECETGSDGVLMLAEIYYNGWKAYVDGVPTHIMEGDYCRKALYLTAGKHDIKFVYRPDSFVVGMVISSVTLLLSIIALVVIGIRKKEAQQ